MECMGFLYWKTMLDGFGGVNVGDINQNKGSALFLMGRGNLIVQHDIVLLI